MTTTAARVCLGMLLATSTATTTAAQDRDFRLMTAVASQDRAAAIALLAEGVDVNAARADGATALLWAAHWDDVDLVERLLAAGADVNLADDHGVTALERAAENASLAMVETLLAAGADVDAAQTSGLTPLMTASRTGNPDVVRTLLAHGADADAAVTETGSTALMWAVSEPHPEIVGLLLDAGADPAASTVKGFTPLMFAARNGDMSIARALLAAGVDVNAPSADGTHVLPFSIVSGQDAFALFLLDEGADPEGEMNGVRALHAAAGGVGTWLREWYARHGGNRLYLRRGRSRLGADRRLPLVEALLARGADPNARITASAMLMSYIGYPKKGAFEPFACGTGDLRGATPLWVAAFDMNGASRTFGRRREPYLQQCGDPAHAAGCGCGPAPDDGRWNHPVHGGGRSRAVDLHATATARGTLSERRGSRAGAAGGRGGHQGGERSRLHRAARGRVPRAERGRGVSRRAGAPTSTRGTSADGPPTGWPKARSSRSSSRAGRRRPLSWRSSARTRSSASLALSRSVCATCRPRRPISPDRRRAPPGPAGRASCLRTDSVGTCIVPARRGEQPHAIHHRHARFRRAAASRPCMRRSAGRHRRRLGACIGAGIRAERSRGLADLQPRPRRHPLLATRSDRHVERRLDRGGLVVPLPSRGRLHRGAEPGRALPAGDADRRRRRDVPGFRQPRGGPAARDRRGNLAARAWPRGWRRSAAWPTGPPPTPTRPASTSPACGRSSP